MEIVDAIARRDTGRAVQPVQDYHSKIIKRTESLPQAQELKGMRSGAHHHTVGARCPGAFVLACDSRRYSIFPTVMTWICWLIAAVG
jgi:hypothetical protein